LNHSNNRRRHQQQQQQPHQTMKLGLVFCAVVFFLADKSSAFSCYSCTDSSATTDCTTIKTCSSSSNTCLKVDYSSGISSRTCGSLQTCSAYSYDVNCCTGDLCNGSSRTSSSSLIMMLMTIPATLALIYNQMF